jgi:hypothetical protein
MNGSITRLLAMVACCGAVALTGCASHVFSGKKMLPWSKSSDRNYTTPERVIAVWTDAVYQLPGKSPTRGFGGRIYFYDGQGQVVPVNGQLIVYAYDDSAQDIAEDRPTRKYAFTAEQLTRYLSESDLGASYSIWIPWDAIGGDEKQIALLPVFMDDSGRMVQGSFASSRLPGRRTLSDEERRGFYVSSRSTPTASALGSATRDVQQVGHHVAACATQSDGGSPGLKVHTIELPPAVSERLQRPATPDRAQQIPAANGSTGVPTTGGFAPAQGTAPWNAPAGSGSFDTKPTAPHPGNGPSSFPAAVTPNQTPLGQQGFVGADPHQSVSAKSRAWARQDSRSAHFERPRFRVPTAPGARPPREHDPTSPSPSTRQFAPPSP